MADALVNLQHVAEAIKHFDIPGNPQEETLYLPLKNARATDVATALSASAAEAHP